MDRKILLVGLGSFLMILMVGAAVLLFTKPVSFRGTTFGEPYPSAPEFALTRSDGTSFRLSEMRGKVLLLFFGYTSCPEECPTTMAVLKQVVEQLDKDQAGQVQVVLITTDPDHDTPEIIQAYANRFNKSFIGLSGSQTELEKIWKDYGIFREVVKDKSVLGYSIEHTARVTLIDQQGNLRVSFGLNTPVEDMAHDLQLILK